MSEIPLMTTKAPVGFQFFGLGHHLCVESSGQSAILLLLHICLASAARYSP